MANVELKKVMTMENKPMLSKDTVLIEVWCNDLAAQDGLVYMTDFELEEQTDEYEIYKACDAIIATYEFKIKVYRDQNLKPGGNLHIATSSSVDDMRAGDKKLDIFVYSVVDGMDDYVQCAMYIDEQLSMSKNGVDKEEEAEDKNDTEVGSDESAESEPLKGFAAVAGMNDLKTEMLDEVKWVIDNKEKAAKYGLHVPNGMLLYGYPGCGKTFFAEKLAEELGVTFMFKRGSELGSHWMHETEQNIGQLFKDAKAQAPCIVCIDEIDGFLPYRRSSDDPGSAFLNAEVNEFLSQMNNCGKDGIMVIGTTNNPGLIDPALLRTGRMDKLVYVPLPDVEARTEMLKLMARNLPCEDSIDYNAVSEASEGMVMSDMECMFHNVAMKCAREDMKLSTDILSAAAKDARRSVYIPKENDKQEEMPITRGVTKIVGFGQVS